LIFQFRRCAISPGWYIFSYKTNPVFSWWGLF
jgi:hypothetical protein